MEVSKTNNTLGFANPIHSSQQQYGVLLWSQFYGPLVGEKKDIYHLRRALIFGLSTLMVIMIILMIFIVIQPDDIFKVIMLGIGISFIIFMLTYAFIRIRKTNKLPIVSLIKQGRLEWDLYEKGILTRNFDENLVDNIKEEFINFDNISKIYFHNNKMNSKKILSLIKAVEKKNAKEFKDSDYILDEEWLHYINNIIWLVDTKGELINHQLEKAAVVDLSRLDELLKQKVANVD